MHSHDRTLLAQLGFADRDKQNPLHDLACQYLIQPEQAHRLAGMCQDVCEELPEPSLHANGHRVGRDEWDRARVEGKRLVEIQSWSLAPRRVHKTALEWAIVKGEGQYKTVIGFADAVVHFSVMGTWTGRGWVPRKVRDAAPGVMTNTADGRVYIPSKPAEWEHDQITTGGEREFTTYTAFIEVKIGECSIGDLLRQIALYRQFVGYYSEHTRWFAAVAFKPTTRFVEELKREGIRTITLGPKFHEWAEAQRAPATSAEAEEL